MTSHIFYTQSSIYLVSVFSQFAFSSSIFRVLSLTLSRTCCRPGACRCSAWSAGRPSLIWHRILRAYTSSPSLDRFQLCRLCWEPQLLPRRRECNGTSQARHSRCSMYKRPCSSVDGCSWATEFSQRSTPASHLLIPARPTVPKRRRRGRDGDQTNETRKGWSVHAATLRRLIGPMEYVGLYTSGKSFSLSTASRYRSQFLAQFYLVVSPRLFHLIALFCLSSAACSTALSFSWLYPGVARLPPTWFSSCFLSHHHILHCFILTALTYRYLHPSSANGISCLWPRSLYLSHLPIRLGVSFHLFSPVFHTSSHHCVSPFFLSLSLFLCSFFSSLAVTDIKKHKLTCALILRLRRYIMRMQEV